jgi:hypothetical protein
MNNTGGPAFPLVYEDEKTMLRHIYLGMTLRDYFAAKAMQEYVGMHTSDYGSKKAYEWADAMLKAREQ